MLVRLAVLAIAGALGAVSRYGLHSIVIKFTGQSSWWGTMTVNTIGCLLAGLLWGWWEHSGLNMDHMRLPVFVGFLGAFTTFSTLILETGDIARTATWMHAGGWLLLQNVVGFAAMAGGAALTQHA